DGFLTMTHYRKFRSRLGEFESFCNVIETQLTKIAGDRTGELDELFRKRRAMIFRPAISALNAFFSRIADGGAMPFRLAAILNTELLAIEDIRAIVTKPGAVSDADAAIVADIDRLEATIKSLGTKAIGFAELEFTPPAANQEDG